METRPLLLLHGALGTSGQFDELLKHLSSEFEPHSFDFRGHGRRVGADLDFTIEAFVQDVLAYLTENDLSQVDLFGYSMGGYVAMVLASRHPDRVGRIMTLGTKVLWQPEEGQREAQRLQVEQLEERVPAFAEQLSKAHGELGWRTVVSRTAAFLEVEMGQSPVLDTPTLEHLDIPVRIAVGDRDETMSLSDVLQVYRTLPQAELEILPATRHPLWKVNMERLAFSLHDFFLQTGE